MAPGQEREETAQPAPTTQLSGVDDQWLAEMVKDAPPPPGTSLETVKELVRLYVDEVLRSTSSVPENTMLAVEELVKGIDAQISTQLAVVMHHPEFQKLEGSWRGLKRLVDNTNTGPSLEIRVLNVSKEELAKDFKDHGTLERSQIYNMVYTKTYDMAGKHPYGALVGDFEFTNHPDDIQLLQNVANLSAKAFCPFVSAASPRLFGMDDFTSIPKLADLTETLGDKIYTKWKAFRESDNSKYVSLVMPRVLSRLPYGKNTSRVTEFEFEEVSLDAQGRSVEVPHDQFCWSNAAYLIAERLTKSFDDYRWCTSIQGVNTGGRIGDLPLYTFVTRQGDSDIKCPAEVPIHLEQEAELSSLGFMPLVYWDGQDYAVCLGSQTVHKPKNAGEKNKEANDSEILSSQLCYMMAVCRITHYFLAMGRDTIGRAMEAEDVQRYFQEWVSQFAMPDSSASEEQKRKHPLRNATVQVTRLAAGKYKLSILLAPWTFVTHITAESTLVAEIKQPR